jgi:Cof subfamily protein (haloacid dehalogenase superfamily)
MGIKLLAMDLDGTVLRDNQTIHGSLPAAFAKAQAHGITLTIATGRAFQSAKRVVAPFAFPGPLICSNGSQVLNAEHETIGTEYMDRKAQIKVLNYAMDNEIHVSAYSMNGVSTIQDTEWLIRYKQLVRGLDIPVLGYDGVMGLDLFKVVLVCREQDLPKHRQNLEFLATKKMAQLTESGPEYLEILPIGANKGNGLAKLAQYLDLDRSEIAAIGDYRNDLEMLDWAGTTGAMKNALPEVKSRAQIVVKSNEEGGVAEFIDHCILLNSREASES